MTASRPLLAGQRGVGELRIDPQTDAIRCLPLVLGESQALSQLQGDFVFFTDLPLKTVAYDAMYTVLRDYASERDALLEIFYVDSPAELFAGLATDVCRRLLAVRTHEWEGVESRLGTAAFRSTGSSELWRVRTQRLSITDPLDRQRKLDLRSFCLEGSEGCVLLLPRPYAIGPELELSYVPGVWPDTREMGIALRKGLKDPYYEAEEAANYFSQKNSTGE